MSGRGRDSSLHVVLGKDQKRYRGTPNTMHRRTFLGALLAMPAAAIAAVKGLRPRAQTAEEIRASIFLEPLDELLAEARTLHGVPIKYVENLEGDDLYARLENEPGYFVESDPDTQRFFSELGERQRAYNELKAEYDRRDAIATREWFESRVWAP